MGQTQHECASLRLASHLLTGDGVASLLLAWPKLYTAAKLLHYARLTARLLPACSNQPSSSRRANSHCILCLSCRSRIFFSNAGSRSNVIFAGWNFFGSALVM